MPLAIAIVAFVLLWLFSQSALADSGDSGGINLEDIVPIEFKDRLSAADITVVARNAGFSGYDLTVAVAIALAESGGKKEAYNPEVAAGTPTGQGSYGLWQIYSKVHPEFATWNLFDPQQNANAAFLVYSAAGASFHPWSTFKNNAYLSFMQAAEDGVTAVG